jgi:hypothetical protein
VPKLPKGLGLIFDLGADDPLLEPLLERRAVFYLLVRYLALSEVAMKRKHIG